MDVGSCAVCSQRRKGRGALTAWRPGWTRTSLRSSIRRWRVSRSMRQRRRPRAIRVGVNAYFFLLACSGLPLRLVEAIFSSSFSLIDETIDLDAPLSLLFGVSPRFADRAAPAAFCWAADLAGIASLLNLRG